MFVTLTLSLPVPRWADDNIDLPSDSNILKTVRVNIAFAATFFKEYSTSFLMVCRLSNGMQVDRLCTCGSQVIDV